MLHGLITALITPMTDEGEIDFVSLESLVNYQIENGVQGLVILGSTGEFNTLNIDERINVINNVIALNNSRVALIVGVSQISTTDAINWIDTLNQIERIDYYLVVTPGYVKPTQNGLYMHFSAIAKVSSRPIILYNVPSRTGVNLMDDTALRLAHDFTNIVGLKDATSDIARCCYLLKHKPNNFALYSGDDATTLAFTLCGGNGSISVTANIVPKIMSMMVANAIDGYRNTATELNNRILKLHDVLFIESNPIPVKWTLFYLNIIKSATLRMPLQILDRRHHEMMKDALKQI